MAGSLTPVPSLRGRGEVAGCARRASSRAAPCPRPDAAPRAGWSSPGARRHARVALERRASAWLRRWRSSRSTRVRVRLTSRWAGCGRWCRGARTCAGSWRRAAGACSSSLSALSRPRCSGFTASTTASRAHESGTDAGSARRARPGPGRPASVSQLGLGAGLRPPCVAELRCAWRRCDGGWRRPSGRRLALGLCLGSHCCDSPTPNPVFCGLRDRVSLLVLSSVEIYHRTHVCKPPRRSGYASSRKEGAQAAAGAADAARARRPDRSARAVRERLGRLPDPFRASIPPRSTTRRRTLAHSYWRIFRSRPSSRSSIRSGAERLGGGAPSRRAGPRRREHSLADASITCSE